MRFNIFLVVMPSLLISCAACGLKAIQPEELYVELFGEQPPDYISVLEGEQLCGMDCQIWLRYFSDIDSQKYFLDKGFTEVKCSDLPWWIVAPEDEIVNSFNPRWVIPQSSITCLHKKDDSPRVNWLIYIVYSAESKQVYAAAATFPS